MNLCNTFSCWRPLFTATGKVFSAPTSRWNHTFAFLDQTNGVLGSTAANTISGASKIGFPITALVAGPKAQEASKAALKLPGVTKVLVAEGDEYLGSTAESLTELILECHKTSKFTHIVAGANSVGKNILPRVAAKLDVCPVSDVIKIQDASTFVRTIYAGNAIATVKSNDSVKVLGLRSTSFPAVEGSSTAVAETCPPCASAKQTLSCFVKQEISKSERPDLGSAKIVISGGRGLKNAENFKILYSLADKLGAAVGASRAAVDAGYVSNDLQIGQTGKIVAPNLYIAVGISGAIQHLAGMKDSKVIVAINKDPEAPIFHVSDYGLVADLFTAVPEITTKL